MQPRWKCLLPLVACLALVGCTATPAGPPATNLEVKSRTLQTPHGDLFGLAWLANGWIVTDYRPDPNSIFGNSRLWHFRADGSDFAEIPVPGDGTCRVLGAFRPVALADGGLGFDRECTGSGFNVDASLERLDPATGAVSVLAPVATDVGASGLASFDWSPTLGRGLVSIGSGICQGIEWIDAAWAKADRSRGLRRERVVQSRRRVQADRGRALRQDGTR